MFVAKIAFPYFGNVERYDRCMYNKEEEWEKRLCGAGTESSFGQHPVAACQTNVDATKEFHNHQAYSFSPLLRVFLLILYNLKSCKKTTRYRKSCVWEKVEREREKEKRRKLTETFSFTQNNRGESNTFTVRDIEKERHNYGASNR